MSGKPSSRRKKAKIFTSDSAHAVRPDAIAPELVDLHGVDLASIDCIVGIDADVIVRQAIRDAVFFRLEQHAHLAADEALVEFL